MPTTRKEPVFNLKAVVQQTGLKPDTLRAWERRYGLPRPQRSGGGHRLYTQQDIDTIRWLMARQRDGLSISRAVELWEQLEAAGRDPLRTPMRIATLTGPALSPQPVGGTIAQLRRQWMDACLAYDEGRAEALLNEAFALYSPETVTIELLQRAMSQIGEGWYSGNVSVQQEHFCSSLAVRRLEALVMAAPAPTRPGRILAACPPEEQHILGLLVLTFLLRRRGWEVVYLGADVPIEQLETTVSVIQPQLVVMAAQLLYTAWMLREAAQIFQQMRVPMAYGGLVFNLLPALRQRIPGHFLGEQIESAPQIVESLMTSLRPVPLSKAIPDSYVQALESFQDRQSLIEAGVIRSLNAAGLTHDYLALANRKLSLNISAALALGDMDLLKADVEWVTGLLRSHGLPVEALYSFLHAYHQTASELLDERGQPIIAWFGRLLNGNTSN